MTHPRHSHIQLKRFWLFLILGGVLVVALGMLFAIPAHYQATLSAMINEPSETVWNRLIDFDDLPKRRGDLERLELLSTTEQGYRQWRVFTAQGTAATFETIEQISGSKLVNKITNSSIGLTGTWTYELTTLTSSSTQLSITEDTTVAQLWPRIQLFFAGRGKNLAEELRSLEN